MDAVHWACVDGLLDAIRGVTVLTNRPRTAEMGFNNKRIGGHVGAVTAADADGFVNPDRLFSKRTTKARLTTCGNNLRL